MADRTATPLSLGLDSGVDPAPLQALQPATNATATLRPKAKPAGFMFAPSVSVLRLPWDAAAGARPIPQSQQRRHTATSAVIRRSGIGDAEQGSGV